MSRGFVLNLVHGVNNLLKQHGTESHEVFISINRYANVDGRPAKARFVGVFQASPQFLNEFVDLCTKYFG